MGKSVWKEFVLQEESTQDFWINLLREAISLERMQLFDHRDILKAAIEIWQELNLYFSLEALLLQDAKQHYFEWAENAVQSLDVDLFMDQTLSSIQIELEKCETGSFLLPCTKKPLLDTLEKTLVKDRIVYLLHGKNDESLLQGFLRFPNKATKNWTLSRPCIICLIVSRN